MIAKTPTLPGEIVVTDVTRQNLVVEAVMTEVAAVEAEVDSEDVEVEIDLTEVVVVVDSVIEVTEIVIVIVVVTEEVDLEVAVEAIEEAVVVGEVLIGTEVTEDPDLTKLVDYYYCITLIFWPMLSIQRHAQTVHQAAYNVTATPIYTYHVFAYQPAPLNRNC